MLNHGTYKWSDSGFKTQRISLNLKSAKIKHFILNEPLYSNVGNQAAQKT